MGGTNPHFKKWGELTPPATAMSRCSGQRKFSSMYRGLKGASRRKIAHLLLWIGKLHIFFKMIFFSFKAANVATNRQTLQQIPKCCDKSSNVATNRQTSQQIVKRCNKSSNVATNRQTLQKIVIVTNVSHMGYKNICMQLQVLLTFSTLFQK